MPKRPDRTKLTQALLLSLALLMPADLCSAKEALPAHVEKALDQAARLEQAGREKLAVGYISQAIALAPKNAALYLKRGDAYNKVCEYDKALKDFDQAISLDSQMAEVYFGRAWANDKLYNFDASAKDYEKYLTFDHIQKREFAGCCLADNLGQLGQTDKAIKVLNKVIEQSPKCSQARRLRGNMLNSDNRDPRQAVVDYTIAMEEKNSHSLSNYALRAKAYTRIKEYAKAIADYTTILKLNPNDDTLYRARAQVYELMGDYKKAIADYSAGISLSPDWGGPNYFSRARCYQKLGQSALAKKDIDECKRLNYDGK